jgi:uncharacterized protein (TIGR03435 family)
VGCVFWGALSSTELASGEPSISWSITRDIATDETVLRLSAIQEQTGLKLETQPGSVDLIVIDRAAKPTGN